MPQLMFPPPIISTSHPDAPTATGHLFFDDGEQLEVAKFFDAKYEASATGFKVTDEFLHKMDALDMEWEALSNDTPSETSLGIIVCRLL